LEPASRASSIAGQGDLSERQAAIRQIERLWQAGHIDESLHRRLKSLLQAPVLASDRTAPAAPVEAKHQVATTFAPVKPAPKSEAAPWTPYLAETPIVAEVVAPAPDAVVATPSAAAVVPVQEATVPVEHRPLSAMLQAFLESRNIRWGELASGVLIVGSAVGLVISLRATLDKMIPYFPALIFMLGTAAIFGAGMYTLRRWRLRSTSRGLLTIAMLLVPLNFLAAVLLSENRPTNDPLYWTAIAVGLGGFGLMALVACRELVPSAGRWLAVGIIGTSAAQLVIDRTTTTGQTSLELLAALTALPVLAYLVATVRTLTLAAPRAKWNARCASRIYMVVGVAAFALAPPLALLVWRGKSIDGTLAVLAPWLSVVAATVLALGMMVYRKSSLAAWRTSGTALAILGGAGMLGTVALAWPRPDLLIGIGLINFAALSVIGRAGRLAPLHAVAGVCLAAAALLGIERMWMPVGFLEAISSASLREILVQGRTAMLLTVFAGLGAIAAGILAHRKLTEESRAYLAATGIVGAGGLAVALVAGFGTGQGLEWATLVFAINAVAALVAAALVRRSDTTLAASGLALLAIGHGLLYYPAGVALLEMLKFGGQLGWTSVLLAHGTLMGVVALGAASTRRLVARKADADESAISGDTHGLKTQATTGADFVTPLLLSAVATSGLAALLLLVVAEGRFALHGGLLLWISALWLAISVAMRDRALVIPGQIIATLGICNVTTAVCQMQGWYAGGWFAAPHVEAQLIVLAIWAVVCHGVRLSARTQPRLASTAKSVEIPVERLLVYGLMMAVTVLVAGACLPAVQQQLGHGDLKAEASWPNLQSTLGGFGGWIGVACIAAAAGTVTRRSARREELILWGALAVSVPLLTAGTFGPGQAAAVLAWTLGFYFVLGVAIVAARTWLGQLRIGSIDSRARTGGVAPHWLALATLGLFGAMPLAWIVGSATMAAGQGTLIRPGAGTWFDGLGPAATWCGPLLLLALGLAVVAVRERKGFVALLACGTTMSATVLAQVIPVWLAGHWVDVRGLAVMLQQVTIVAALLAIAWQWISRLAARRAAQDDVLGAPSEIADFRRTPDEFLSLQLGVTVVLGVLLALWPAVAIFLVPAALDAAVLTLGRWPSYLALLLTAWSLGLAKGHLLSAAADRRVHYVLAGFVAACLAVPVVAATMAPLLAQTQWLSFHVLSGGWAALAMLATGMAIYLHSRSVVFQSVTDFEATTSGESTSLEANATLGGAKLATFLGTVLGTLTLLMAARFIGADPSWWAPGLIIAIASTTAAHAVFTRRESLAYLTAALAWGALLTFWIGLSIRWSDDFLFNFLQQSICLESLLATAWLGVTVAHAHRAMGTGVSDHPPRRHSLALVALFGGLGLAALLESLGSLAARANYHFATFGGLWGWSVLACLSLLALVLLWSRQARFAPLAFYALGPLALGLILDAVAGTDRQWALGAVMGAAGWVTLTGMAWLYRSSWIALGRGLRTWAPEDTAHSVWRWLPTLNVLATAAVILASGSAELLFGYRQETRILAALAVALAAPGLAMFGQGHLRLRMPRLALIVGAISAVYLAWAIVPLTPEDTFWLRMGTRTLVALGAMSAVYGLGLVRVLGRDGDWMTATRQSAALLGFAALGSLIVVLGLEAIHFKAEGDIIPITEVAQVAVVLVGLAGALLSLALLPGADPLGLSEKGRMLYVYAAEAVLALLFAHIYLTMPYLFHQRLRPYWPLIVVAISYAGVIFSMLARRAGLKVLSEPLERTGGFLPLLPALGFWFLTSQVSYSAVMAAVGVGYVLLSAGNRRLIYRVAAAVAGNAALWALMHEQGVAPWEYPSFWALPPAFSLLIAAHLNRSRLSDDQLTAIRYLCITVIYLSATGQIWVMLGESLWPPMLLALLSVAGILAGMALRVRAFLYQGMSFLGLAVLSMIWHASRHIGHVWPWWAFGVVLGLSILALFGLFEKKRPEVLLLVERMRQWER